MDRWKMIVSFWGPAFWQVFMLGIAMIFLERANFRAIFNKTILLSMGNPGCLIGMVYELIST